MTPRRSPDPWFLAGAPSKLSVHPVDLDFQLFGRLKLHAVPQVHPPLFELGGARIASESASIVVGSSAGFDPFLGAPRPAIPVNPIDPRVREGSHQGSEAGVHPREDEFENPSHP